MNLFELNFNNIFKKYVKKNINQSIKIDSKIIENIDTYIILKLCIVKYLNLHFNIDNIFCTKSHWNNLYNFMKASKQGKIFILYKNIFILQDRDSYILYINNFYNYNFYTE